MRTLLIDADIIAYQFASAAQQNFKWDDQTVSSWCEDISEVTPAIDDKLAELKAQLDADALVICLSCPTDDGWRRALLPSYKVNRGPKPLLLGDVKEHLRKNYKTYERPTLEADDVMGILSTHPTLIKGEKVIVSIDKDMKCIPGWLFNPSKYTSPLEISEVEADRWHLYQTLCGDSTDNYKGCPGIGPVKAEAFLNAITKPEDRWYGVKRLYEAKGLTEEDALLQARVARICRASDYDFKRKEVILWSPAIQTANAASSVA